MQINTKTDRGYVLVHPHFDPSSLFDIAFAPSLSRQIYEPTREYLYQYANGSEKAVAVVARNEVLHRFYRKEIDRISKDSNAKLFILRTVYDTKDPVELKKLEIKIGLAGDTLCEFCNAILHLQDRLIAYALNKLGARLYVSEEAPSAITQEAIEFFGDYKNVTVFGETLGHCVAEAHEALEEYFDSRICKGKCPT